MEDCKHVWVSNSGMGDKPIFKKNSQMGPVPLMHVRCEKCGCRTWLTEGQWHKAENVSIKKKKPGNRPGPSGFVGPWDKTPPGGWVA